MNESNPSHRLDYAIEHGVPSGPRPRWVWAVVGVYCCLIVCAIGIAAWIQWDAHDSGVLLFVGGSSIVLLSCGLGLLLTPVRVARRRPLTRTGLWIPIVTSGFLIGLLVLGAGTALHAVAKYRDEVWFAMLGGAVIVWIFWMIALWLLTRGRDPTSILSRLHRWLIGGSVAELLVAVPSHVIVRRRHECCADIVTGTAICVGAVVMIISLGPAVAFLYVRRWKQIR